MTTRRKRIVKPASFWRSWRHIAAYVYLTICAFDFVVMPGVYELFHRRLSDLQLIEAVKPLDASVQIEAMKILHDEQRWEPITLAESGLFHIAFGAILTGAAVTRGMEKINRVKNGSEEGEVVMEDAPADAEEAQ